jgi:hypothetical protein
VQINRFGVYYPDLDRQLPLIGYKIAEVKTITRTAPSAAILRSILEIFAQPI